MSPVYNPNVAQADVIHLWDGQRVENTLYFFSTTTPDEIDLQNLATNLRDFWVTNHMPLMSNKVSLFLIETLNLTPVPAYTGSAAPSTPVVGGNTNPALPNNVTISVSFRTGFSGRSFRGRNYFLGLTEPDVTDNIVSATLLASVANAYAQMIGPNAVADGWRWGVYSRQVDNVPRETGLFTDITSVVITDSIVDSQRRRLPGRGR